MEQIVWQQVFSNYHNLNYNLDKPQRLCFLHNTEGDQLRLEMTNQYDEQPLIVDSLRISDNAHFEQAVTVTSEGMATFNIPAFSKIWTDTVSFPIHAGKPLYVEITVRNQKGTINTLASSLDHHLVEVLDYEDDIQQNFYFGITTIQAETSSKMTIGFFGDSLTNQGYFSNQVATMLYEEYPNEVTTFNAGISGNRLLLAGNSKSEWNESFGPAGVERFKVDVLEKSPQLVVSMIGINDLFHPGAGCPENELPTADALIKAIKKLSEVCSERGILFVPMTITPFKGAVNREISSWNPIKEAIRSTVNDFIRSYPHCIDIAARIEQTDDVASLQGLYDCGDHLHFSPDGAVVIGTAVFNVLKPLIDSAIKVEI